MGVRGRVRVCVYERERNRIANIHTNHPIWSCLKANIEVGLSSMKYLFDSLKITYLDWFKLE